VATAPARAPEAYVAALVRESGNARVPEAYVAALTKVQTPARVPEAYVAALAYAEPQATARCDCWKITRRDGTVFAFTSLDRPFAFAGAIYQPCGSLQDTATESSAEIGNAGSVTLTGLLTSEAITDADIYSGLFDDAYVECWTVSYGPNPDPGSPRRRAAGWLGKITRGQASYEAEVLGPGARLAQTALVKFFTPGCRWVFGGPECTVDATALEITGREVTEVVGRGIIVFAPQAVPSVTAIWNNGSVLWTSGANLNVLCQTETVDWAAGLISLWDLTPFTPSVGDTFTVIPGCSYNKDGCNEYGNYINFGGFSDVPGPDSLQQNADALFAGNTG
jgi:uncharacterized phage protein (TIGR02218 family)